jgi:hypothetical protein
LQISTFYKQEPPTLGGFPFALVYLHQTAARPRPKGRFSFALILDVLSRSDGVFICPAIPILPRMQTPYDGIYFPFCWAFFLPPVLLSLRRQKSNIRSFTPFSEGFPPDFPRKTHQAPDGFCAGESLS